MFKQRVAQIGLGHFGVLRAWAWNDVGLDVTVFDPKIPPLSRLPKNIRVASSIKDAVKDADIVCATVPPENVCEVTKNLGNRLVVLEKPAGINKNEAMDRIYALKQTGDVVVGFVTIYDACVQGVLEEIRNAREAVTMKAARMHRSNLHKQITVVEDVSVHDLVIADSLGMLDNTTEYIVSGHSPEEVHIELKSATGDTAVIDSCVVSPNRIRHLEMNTKSMDWTISLDQFALNRRNGQVIPPCQARPMYVECNLLAQRAKNPNIVTLGEIPRVERIWTAIEGIRNAWEK